jgi:hypothetical protein
MAKIDLNPMFKGVHGKLDDIVFRKVRGETIMSPMPERSEDYSEAQLEQQERWRKAANYGNLAQATPEMWELYVKAGKELDTNPFSLCIADYLNAPEVVNVDSLNYNGQAGSTIAIETEDDFGVVKVEVVLTKDGDGTLIEQGLAVEIMPGKGIWTYTATQVVPIGTEVTMQVTAFDRPGGSGAQTVSRLI